MAANPQGFACAAPIAEAKAVVVSTLQMCLAPPRADAFIANPSGAKVQDGASSIAWSNVL